MVQDRRVLGGARPPGAHCAIFILFQPTSSCVDLGGDDRSNNASTTRAPLDRITSWQIYGADMLYLGFRDPVNVRFVGQEDGYLSYTSDGPRMFMNIEDWLKYQGENNISSEAHPSRFAHRSI